MMLELLFLVTRLTFVSALPTNPWKANSEASEDGLSQYGSLKLSQDEENQPDHDNEIPASYLPATDFQETLDASQDNIGLSQLIDEADYNTLPEIDSETLQALIKVNVYSGLCGAKGMTIYDSGSLDGITSGLTTWKQVPTVSAAPAAQIDVQKYIDKLSSNPQHQIQTILYVDPYFKNTAVFGDHDNAVSLGAQSDSVVQGPGINDDGKFKINNALRFAWWTAEEDGLLGSTSHADKLSSKDNSKVCLFMDYDPVTSPNFVYEVYHANNQAHPNGSGNLKQLYIDCEKVKDKFGGKAGESFDPCYHQLCDNLDNLHYSVWVINTKSIAHSVTVYAKCYQGFPKV
ncbi:Aminopeptidase Y [Spathaspora sp. JA1]|nr:Aminopeptidase Y [Spathaspora sp. JA1]